MDLNKYYELQASGLPGYHGPRYQKGHGLGSMFKRFFKWAVPIIQQHSSPILDSMKTSVAEGLGNFSKDLVSRDQSGEQLGIKASAKRRIMETFDDIKKKLQKGGKKRRIAKKHKNNKKHPTNKKQQKRGRRLVLQQKNFIPSVFYNE